MESRLQPVGRAVHTMGQTLRLHDFSDRTVYTRNCHLPIHLGIDESVATRAGYRRDCGFIDGRSYRRRVTKRHGR